MSVKANYFKIGVFTVSAVALVIVALVVLNAGRWLKRNVHWETYFDESVQGLAVGAPIKYRGVQVGSVEHIDFVGNEYGLELSQEDLVRYGRYVLVRGSATHTDPHLTESEKQAARAGNIIAGLRVRLASQGVTGVVYLELDYLDPKEYPVMEVPWNPEREYIPSAPSTITVLGSALHNIARDLEKADIHTITRDLDTLVLEVTKAVQGVDLRHLSDQIGQTLAEFQTTAQQTRRLVDSREFRQILSHAAGTLAEARNMVADLAQVSKRINTGSEKLPDMVSRLERSLRRIDTLLANKSPDVEETIENLRVMSENLRELSDNAKRYPAQVLLGEPPPRLGVTKR